MFRAFVITAGLLGLSLSAVAQTPDQKQIAHMQAQLADWPDLAHYANDNAALPLPAPSVQRVVFFGDSITDIWGRQVGTFFSGKPYVNRGISGQTTPQMLIRFMPDVVALKPSVVLVLAGTNDIAGNTGAETPDQIEANFVAMNDIAKQHGIRMIIASILPAAKYPWKPEIADVPAKIRAMNDRLRALAEREHLVYLDYYSAMADQDGAMKPGLSTDGVHPTAQGFAVMGPLAEAAIQQALTR